MESAQGFRWDFGRRCVHLNGRLVQVHEKGPSLLCRNPQGPFAPKQVCGARRRMEVPLLTEELPELLHEETDSNCGGVDANRRGNTVYTNSAVSELSDPRL